MDRFLTPDDVCALVPGMTKKKLENLRTARVGPTFYKPTFKTVVYKESDLFAWLESTRVETRRS